MLHIYGSTGARAAVLAKYPNAKVKVTSERGPKYPICLIKAGKSILGQGHGISDAWEQTANNIYTKPSRASADTLVDGETNNQSKL